MHNYGSKSSGEMDILTVIVVVFCSSKGKRESGRIMIYYFVWSIWMSIIHKT